MIHTIIGMNFRGTLTPMVTGFILSLIWRPRACTPVLLWFMPLWTWKSETTIMCGRGRSGWSLSSYLGSRVPGAHHRLCYHRLTLGKAWARPGQGVSCRTEKLFCCSGVPGGVFDKMDECSGLSASSTQIISLRKTGE